MAKVSGIGKGAPMPERPKPTISEKLNRNVTVTRDVAEKMQFVEFSAKKSGYTKGPADAKSAKKETAVAGKHMLRYRPY